MSDCLKIYNANLVDQATLTPSTENALFPATNLQDYRRSKVYRSTLNSDNIVIDFQESSEVNAIFIVGSKRDGLGVSTITVEFNATANFSSPAYSVSVPMTEQFGMGYVSFTTVEYRFARIVMTSTLGYCELSKVFMGKEMGLTKGMSFGWTFKDEELSTKTFNRYGQIFADIISRQKVIGLAIKLLDKDDLELLHVMFDRVGEIKPFYITIGNANMAVDYRRYSGPVILDDVPTITNGSFNRYNLSMTVKELM